MHERLSRKAGWKAIPLVVSFLALFASLAGLLAQTSGGGSGYRLLRALPVAGYTGGDYLSTDSVARLLYITDNSGAIVFDVDKQQVVGHVPEPPFTHGIGLVHGVAIAPEFNRGFLSREIPPSVVVFDLSTLRQIRVTQAGPGTDSVIYDPASKRVFTFNGKKAGVHDATVIDARSGQSIGTIPLPGIPEFPAVDDAGHLYVNISTQSALAEIDTKTLEIIAIWPLAPCEGPSGLAMDVAHRRLFAGCDNKLMVMVNADTGKVVATVPIGEGVDADAFDPATGYAFASNGEGTLTIAHEDSPNKLTLVENIRTGPGARTMALDPKTHHVFLISAKFQTSRPSASPDNPHRYPLIVPSTAKLLVFGR